MAQLKKSERLKEILYGVESGYFTAGFLYDEAIKKIVIAAPIIKYFKGKGLKWAEWYTNKKKWELQKIKEFDKPTRE